MMPEPPEVSSLVLEIPDSCRMRGEFTELEQVTGEWTIRVVFGNSQDAVQLRFERPALVRFVQLGVDLLSGGPPDEDR